jgi:hypothetical protein
MTITNDSSTNFSPESDDRDEPQRMLPLAESRGQSLHRPQRFVSDHPMIRQKGPLIWNSCSR